MEEEKQRFHCLKCKRTAKTMTSFTARRTHTYRCENDKHDIYECPGADCADCPVVSKIFDQIKSSHFGPD